MPSPKVSVLIPTYNYARFLPEAIESVLNQEYDDYELLVIDDASSDATKSVVEKYSAGHPHLRFRVNSANLGMVENWNLCLREARGEYVKYLFGDDALASRSTIGTMASALDSDPSVSLVGSARNFIDEASNVLHVATSFRRVEAAEGAWIITRCLLAQSNLIGEPTTAMFRRKDAERGFLPSYRQLVDLEMWFHLLEKGRFAYIDEPLSSFRQHPRQQTGNNLKALAHLDDMMRLCDEYMPKPYVRIGGFDKMFLLYEILRRIWEADKRGEMHKGELLREIERRWGMNRFHLALPLYGVFLLKRRAGNLARKLRGGI